MYCEDVKQVRNFIKVVADYTNSTVNVLGYSMGSPISRKAILGGKCVDTHEDLGEPLTPLVNTFISLAGVTYGLQPCLNYKTYAACNLVNGMISGSEYLNDINSMETKYEGNTTYSIQSSNDYLVGQKCGSEQCSELKNSNENIYKNGNDHVTIVSTTVALQYELFDKL
uniref:Triacylglycerol lipase n=1 Tax=Rhabditophanes sp. KR3021 TaxID=114890 RepID=A0AC35UFJ0_9BILA